MKTITVITLISAALHFWHNPAIGKEDKIKRKHTLFVFSDPPLSDIYVDGVKQEAPTPAVIRVPANAQPVIEIKKNGHKPYKKTISTKGSGSKFSATLKKSPKKK